MTPVITTTNNETGEVKHHIFKKKEKPKTFGVRPGQCFYSVEGRQIREAVVVSIKPASSLTGRAWVKYRVTGVSGFNEVYTKLKGLHKTKKAAHRELLADLRKTVKNAKRRASYPLQSLKVAETNLKNALKMKVK